MAIRREITVTRKGLSSSIDMVHETNLLPLEFVIIDFTIPSGAIAVAYVETPGKDLRKQVCDIAEDVITFTPDSSLFDEGKNVIQLRVTYEEKNLFTFETIVNCSRAFVTDDGEEVESQPTLVAQILTKLGKIPTSDTKDNTISFESVDALDSEESPLEWTDVEVLKSGEKHSSILTKVTTMFKNVRYLALKMFNHDLQNNVVTFDSYDSADEYEGDYVVPSITTGEKLSSVLSKITKFTNNIRYLFDFIKVADIQDAGFTSVADAIDTLSVDYIVEQGTSGIWDYTKWASGKVELSGYAESTVAIDTLVGNGYRCAQQSVSLPFTVYKPKVWADCADLNTWAGTMTYPTQGSANGVSYVLYRHSVYASYSWFTNLLVKGRWKE